jgi:CheY-like chemotaxis protein
MGNSKPRLCRQKIFCATAAHAPLQNRILALTFLLAQLIGVWQSTKGAPVSKAKTRLDPVVLVVDNDRDCREMFGEVLKLAGFGVFFAEDAEQAFELACSLRPCVVSTELLLPRIDGFEFCSRLREDPRTGGIAVVAVTALAERKYRLRAKRCGCHTVLPKPCLPDAYVSAVRMALEASHCREG